MDLHEIQEAIYSFENGVTNFDNVQKLACLYICKDNLQKANNQQHSTEKELGDILPQYRQYCDIKRKYQLHEVTEDAVICEMKKLCKEIEEFLSVIYSNTDFFKERRLLLVMLENLNFN